MKSMEEMLKAAQQAAETIEQQMTEMQGKLDLIEVAGVAGGGLVKIRTSAKGRMIGVSIDDSLMAVAEKSMLEDLITAALNDAKAKADIAASAEMQKMSVGLPLPPGFKMPF